MPLVDLDAEILRIRDPRSRAYFSDALKSYRAGAFRAALSSTWVVLIYDILRKYRELDTLGDKEAHAFLECWDKAVSNNNIGKLLEIERQILDHSFNKMEIIDSTGVRILKRLFEDRNLAAHPAFTSQDELYEPTDETVRAHMVSAIALVLSQRPVQGKGIIDSFSNDLQSPGFPSSESGIANHVEVKYINNMRDHVIRNFGIVLSKSLVQNVPADWQSHYHEVSVSLRSIQDRKPDSWPAIETELIRMINDDEPDNRLRCVLALSRFPNFISRIDITILAALNESIKNDNSLLDFPQVFDAVKFEDFRDSIEERFSSLEDKDAANVLSFCSPIGLWKNCLDRYANAGSFRWAEALFEQLILPFQSILEEAQLSDLCSAVHRNNQIWDAALTPQQFLNLCTSVRPHRPSDAALDELYDELSPRIRAAFEGVWKLMEEQGWQRPNAKDPSDEDEADDDI